MKGILYGVGVGPGDPELLTLKAAGVLEEADVIAVPDTGGDNTALKIVENYISGKEKLFCPTPMTRDKKEKLAAREKSAAVIAGKLDMGKTVAFITLGDPSVYSTYMYIHRIIVAMGYEAVIVPGVPSFCASAAALGVSLCDGGEPLHIIPASYGGLAELLGLPGTKVLMKSGKSMETVKNDLKKAGLYETSAAVEKCGMEGERVYENMDAVPDCAGYFSVIISKSGSAE